ncbi:TolC family protein [Roseimaritima sediminicola]|uniref:TolC family protein n=1 Tax=Roseimaritima sediminicola TaxID=2662066 RepID=UPI00192A51BA|nr:TolC family protein [Roseimaritima sediminicola]
MTDYCCNRRGTVPLRLLALVLAVCACAVLCSCAKREPIGKFTHQPLPEFSESGLVRAADHWWIAFGDPELNTRVQQAFDNNYDLASALQRVVASRAVARRQASDFFADVNGVVTHQSIFGPEEDRYPTVIGLDAAYQVDLWGRIESQVAAERFRAAATYADYQAVALTLSAEVARTWFALIEARAQLELLDAQIETNRTGVESQEDRFGLGLVGSADVLRQRQLLQATLEQYTVVQSQVETLEHQMSVLLGELPQTASYDPGTDLPAMPPLPAAGVPAELLQRRPDVRRDYLAFVAANHDLAAAVSDQFPRLNLTGSVENLSDSPETLFRDWFVSIGGQLIAPLLDGGQRRAEVDRSAAVARQLFNQYGQTMLVAFQEVEDALAQERYQRERLEYLEKQVELAYQSTLQLREQYLIGDEDYLAVLTAITGWQRLQRETLSAQLDLRLIRISLYLALAGGIDPRATVITTVDTGPGDARADHPAADNDPADSDPADNDPADNDPANNDPQQPFTAPPSRIPVPEELPLGPARPDAVDATGAMSPPAVRLIPDDPTFMQAIPLPDYASIVSDPD